MSWKVHSANCQEETQSKLVVTSIPWFTRWSLRKRWQTKAETTSFNTKWCNWSTNTRKVDKDYLGFTPVCHQSTCTSISVQQSLPSPSSQPYYFKILTPQIKVCAGCRLGYTNREPPYDVCLVHKVTRNILTSSVWTFQLIPIAMRRSLVSRSPTLHFQFLTSWLFLRVWKTNCLCHCIRHW